MQGVYNGYGNSEKLRMHNLHCSHSHFMHQTNPCEYFAEYLYKAVKQMECADPDSEALCIEESSKIHELCGNGTCQQCALYLLVKLLNDPIISSSGKWLFQKKIHQNRTICATITNTGYTTMMATLFWNIMLHPHLCKYAFSRHCFFFKHILYFMVFNGVFITSNIR
eukprot:547971_1